MQRFRAFGCYVVLLGLVAVVAGFAWLTQNPETPWLERAEAWPVVGPWAADMRRAYLPPEARLPVDGGVAKEGGSVPERVVIVRQPRRIDAREMVWVMPDTVLRSAPDPAARELLTAEAMSYLAIEERRGEWLRIALRGRVGWIPAPPDDGPPLGSEPEPPKPLPERPPNADRLAVARDLLGIEAPVRAVGSYPLYTDVAAEDPRLTALDRAARAVETAYRRLLDLEPVGQPAAAVLLFGSRDDYRSYQRTEPRLRDLHPAGFVGSGLVVLDGQGRPAWEVSQTLIHEVVHLLNRRSLGPALPTWLDEGLAELFAGFPVGADGSLDLTRFSGAVQRSGAGVTFQGGQAQLRMIARELESGRGPSLETLFELGWGEFVRPGSVQRHYATSGLLMRYLLQGGGAESRDGLLAFLRAVSAGRSAEGATLLEAVGKSADELESELADWVRLQRDLRAQVTLR